MRLDQRNNYYNIEKERLQREIAQREAQLNALNASVLHTHDRMISESLSRKQKFSDKTYFRFIFASLKESKLYGVWERLIKYFRRFRLLTTILQIVGYIITFISTGAFFLSFLSVVIIALPFALVATLTGIISSILNRRKIIRHFKTKSDLSSTSVIFLPVSSAENASGAFITKTANKLAGSGETVFVIRPLNSKYKSKPNSSNVYFINQSDYFYFKKHLFLDLNEVTQIYM